MWIAGWNMPGYLPETDPLTFDDWNTARDYLVSELNLWADQEGCENDDFMRAISSVRDLESRDYEDDSWSSHHQISGHTFWIERSNARER